MEHLKLLVSKKENEIFVDLDWVFKQRKRVEIVLEVVARRNKTSERTVSRVLTKLVNCGYIKRYERGVYGY